MTVTTSSLAEVTRSDAALRTFLHGLPGVDAVGADARAAMLSTRSIKTTAKAWAIDLAIRMVDLTTLEGADTPGKVRALCAKAMRPDTVAVEGRHRRQGAGRLGRAPGQRGHRVPVRAGAARRQAGRHPRGGGRRRGR